MATVNPFDLLGDDDSGDVLNVPAITKEKQAPKKPAAPVQAAVPAKLPSKPLPPAQAAVREARGSQGEGGRGRGRGGRGFGNRENEFGRGRGGVGDFNGDRAFNRENYNGYHGGRGGFYEGSGEDGEVVYSERVRGGRGGGRGGRGSRSGVGGRGGFAGAEGGVDDTHKRVYERRSGTGRGNEMKREGGGRGNWGTPVDQGAFQETEEVASGEEEKITTGQKAEDEKNQETPVADEEKKEEEDDKEMTLDEYEKVVEEKRKALAALQKVEERKVDTSAFESMKQLSIKKKDEGALFLKVASDKEKAKKGDAGELVERVKKQMSINEFLKPAEGEQYYASGRGRGRGRGGRGGFRGGFGGGANAFQAEAPSIEDEEQFPTLGGK